MAKKTVALFVGITYLYNEYRYGPKNEVRLPSPSSHPILGGARRRKCVDKVADILGTWHSSHFEHEGVTRAGLRSEFCLQGYRWSLADREAESIVGDALKAIGAKRPTEDEGQPRYIDIGDFCMHCGQPMPDDLVTGGRKQRYCSFECASAERVLRKQRGELSEKTAMFAIRGLMSKQKMKPKVCAECGKDFVSSSAGWHAYAKYCSRDCFAASYQRDSKKAPRDCLACGTTFKPWNADQKYCGKKCARGAVLERYFISACQACGTTFRSNMPKQIYCGKVCNGYAYAATHNPPKKMSAKVFDFTFTGPIAAARFEVRQKPQEPGEVVALSFGQPPSWGKCEPSTAMFLTSGIFDQMMAA